MDMQGCNSYGRLVWSLVSRTVSGLLIMAHSCIPLALGSPYTVNAVDCWDIPHIAMVDCDAGQCVGKFRLCIAASWCIRLISWFSWSRSFQFEIVHWGIPSPTTVDLANRSTTYNREDSMVGRFFHGDVLRCMISPWVD
jgi:hypothetical protein